MSRGRQAVVLVVAIALSALGLGLGFWQLGRAEQKLELQQAVDAQRQRPPLRSEELPADAAAVATQLQRGVTLEGRWLGDATVLLENRPMDGRTGFIVVTPLRLPDGRTVAVQRGWIARDRQDRRRIAPYATPANPVRVQGRLVREPSRAFELGATEPGPIRQNLDLDAYGREFRITLLPFAVVQEDADGTLADGLLRHWPPPAVDVHKHYGYAFQWFALSALIVGLYVWFRIIRPWRRA